jgi:hypothetical protein
VRLFFIVPFNPACFQIQVWTLSPYKTGVAYLLISKLKVCQVQNSSRFLQSFTILDFGFWFIFVLCVLSKLRSFCTRLLQNLNQKVWRKKIDTISKNLSQNSLLMFTSHFTRLQTQNTKFRTQFRHQNPGTRSFPSLCLFLFIWRRTLSGLCLLVVEWPACFTLLS